MTSTSLFFILGQWFFQQILGLDELYLRMKEAKLSVSNDITNTTETHARGFSWKTQEEGLQLEAATDKRNDPPKLLPREEGVFLGIIGGGDPPGSPNPDPISDQQVSILTLFQTWPQLFKSHSAIRWIDLYPADNAIGFPNTYPLDSAIQLLNNRDLAFKKLFLHYLD